MDVLITGSKGFIGSNLKYFLKLNTSFNILEHNRSDTEQILKKKINRSNIIFHFGGENRSKKKENFLKNNYRLSKIIAENALPKSLIIYSSTLKVNENSIYGKTKKRAEGVLKKFYKKKKYKLSILRLPNIFGKWGRPNHNSVVATFCYNSSRNIKSNVNNPEQTLKLLYIDDLILQIMKILKRRKNILYPEIKTIYKIKLKNLYQKISSLNQNRLQLNTDIISSPLDKKIYSTYLTYMPEKKYVLKYKKNEDKRGNFSELLKSKKNGQVSYFSINPGKTRGNHFHFTKVEKFFPIYGKGKIVYKNINNSKKKSYNFNFKNPQIFEAIPGWSHKFVNNTKSEAIFIVWANETFDKKNPDTYYHKI
tara:strand:+ start:253 stop:1347 length:1095 start_codon:yes stop_codon:yes gene_type:complete